MSEQYCTLSHCWGRPSRQPMQTTKRTLAQRLRSIDYNELPKTYKDAVFVTRSVGIKYLWIDSLCIVQDDEQDWLAESKEMHRIYQRSQLTIAASGAEGSSVGCFINRSHSLASEPVPFYKGLHDEGPSGFFYAHQVFRTYPADEPLAQRGWAVQERLLSRRVVHFTKGGVGWQCRESEVNEHGDCLNLPPPPTGYWEEFLRYYVPMKLTYEKDRLIALQGLASEMQLARNDHYHFGIWTGGPPSQLLWLSESNSADRLADIPSWSWASKPGSKFFCGLRGLMGITLNDKFRFESISIDSGGVMHIQHGHLRSCTVTNDLRPRTPNRFTSSNTELSQPTKGSFESEHSPLAHTGQCVLLKNPASSVLPRSSGLQHEASGQAITVASEEAYMDIWGKTDRRKEDIHLENDSFSDDVHTSSHFGDSASRGDDSKQLPNVHSDKTQKDISHNEEEEIEFIKNMITKEFGIPASAEIRYVRGSGDANAIPFGVVVLDSDLPADTSLHCLFVMQAGVHVSGKYPQTELLSRLPMPVDSPWKVYSPAWMLILQKDPDTMFGEACFKRVGVAFGPPDPDFALWSQWSTINII